MMLKTLFTGRRLLMTLLVIAGAGVLCRLGIWQLDRLAQRRATNALINGRMAEPPVPLGAAPADLADLEYRRVELRGTYDPDQEVVLRSRALDGVPGVHLLTPLRLSGSGAAVLVNRGWVPMAQAAPEARRALAEEGEVVVRGVVRLSQEQQGPPRDLPLTPDRPRLDGWFRVNIPRIQQQIDYPLLPVFVQVQPAPGDPPLPRRVPVTDLGEGSHFGYAIQWFAFALILLVGYLSFTYQQLHRPQDGKHPLIGVKRDA
jgi:surfeit locus 1 family protein